MSSLLTLEDYNSVNTKYVNEYYTLDTSKISEQEFEMVLYDFVKVSHAINGNNHTFTFEIMNNLWTGGYWFNKINGDYINVDADSPNDTTILFTTTESQVILNLYLCSFATRFQVTRLEYILLDRDVVIITKKDLGKIKRWNIKNLHDGSAGSTSYGLREGVWEWLS